MARPPRKPRVNKPSPLQQVHLTRPISQNPEMGLVRDPAFWKRFSTAVHMAEEGGVEPDTATSTRGARVNSDASASTRSTFNVKDDNDWLRTQHKKKRRCRLMCVSITLIIIMLAIGAAIIAWYFTKVRKIT